MMGGVAPPPSRCRGSLLMSSAIRPTPVVSPSFRTLARSPRTASNGSSLRPCSRIHLMTALLSWWSDPSMRRPRRWGVTRRHTGHSSERWWTTGRDSSRPSSRRLDGRSIRSRWRASGCVRCGRPRVSRGEAFAESRTQALFAGMAGHGMLPLDTVPTAAFGLVLSVMAHVAGWVLPKGGAQSLSDALAAHLRSLGGEIVTGTMVRSIDELPPARAVLCDLTPRPLLRIAGHRFPDWYRRKLERYRYGMGVFKVDWALDGPIPWRAQECARAGTVHLGGTLEEIARSERDAWEGRPSERPFILLTQPTLFDPSRAPAGRHVAWAYCHVPHASGVDMLERIESQIERFAPGFRDRVLARSVMGPAALERHNAKRPRWGLLSCPSRYRSGWFSVRSAAPHVETPGGFSRSSCSWDCRPSSSTRRGRHSRGTTTPSAPISRRSIHRRFSATRRTAGSDRSRARGPRGFRSRLRCSSCRFPGCFG